LQRTFKKLDVFSSSIRIGRLGAGAAPRQDQEIKLLVRWQRPPSLIPCRDLGDFLARPTAARGNTDHGSGGSRHSKSADLIREEIDLIEG
jgi:hypothetical protein